MTDREFGFSYDNIGNRLDATVNTVTTDYTANALNQYTTIDEGTPVTPTYDADGNLLSDGTGRTFVWTAENRLKAVNIGAETISFEYDYMGRRVIKDFAYSDIVIETFYVYDGWNLIAEYEGANTLAKTYTWGTDLSGTLQGAGGVGGLLSTTDYSGSTPASYYYTYDANGNVSEVLNNSGSTVAHYEYGPFGETVASVGTYSDENPFCFSTKYTDNQTDLVYYGYRYYDSEMGRWLNRDPIGIDGGLNENAHNNQFINLIDPFGLKINVEVVTGEEVAEAYRKAGGSNARKMQQVNDRTGFHVSYEGDGCTCADGSKGEVVLVQYIDEGWISEDWKVDNDSRTEPYKEPCPKDPNREVTRQPAYTDAAPGDRGGVGDGKGGYYDSPYSGDFFGSDSWDFKIEAWCRCPCEDDTKLEEIEYTFTR